MRCSVFVHAIGAFCVLFCSLLGQDRLEKVPHYCGAQRVYWGVLRPRMCTQKVKPMLGWRWFNWPLTSPWKRRLQVAPSVLVVSPPTAVGFGGILHHVASPDRICSRTGSTVSFRA